MSPLADRILGVADRVHLAEAWLERDDVDQARTALVGVHDDLVALAGEVSS